MLENGFRTSKTPLGRLATDEDQGFQRIKQISKEFKELLKKFQGFLMDSLRFLKRDAGGVRPRSGPFRNRYRPTAKPSDHEVVRFEIAISRDRRILRR